METTLLIIAGFIVFFIFLYSVILSSVQKGIDNSETNKILKEILKHQKKE